MTFLPLDSQSLAGKHHACLEQQAAQKWGAAELGPLRSLNQEVTKKLTGYSSAGDMVEVLLVTFALQTQLQQVASEVLLCTASATLWAFGVCSDSWESGACSVLVQAPFQCQVPVLWAWPCSGLLATGWQTQTSWHEVRLSAPQPCWMLKLQVLPSSQKGGSNSFQIHNWSFCSQLLCWVPVHTHHSGVCYFNCKT